MENRTTFPASLLRQSSAAMITCCASFSLQPQCPKSHWSKPCWIQQLKTAKAEAVKLCIALGKCDTHGSTRSTAAAEQAGWKAKDKKMLKSKADL